jgi:hypothetical protein
VGGGGILQASNLLHENVVGWIQAGLDIFDLAVLPPPVSVPSPIANNAQSHMSNDMPFLLDPERKQNFHNA